MAPKRTFAGIASEWSLVFAILACPPSLIAAATKEAVRWGRHGREIGADVGPVVLALLAVSVALALIGVFAAPRKSNWVVVWTLIVIVVAHMLLFSSIPVRYS